MTTAVGCGSDQRYCRDCGKVVMERAEICHGCGCRQTGAALAENVTANSLLGIAARARAPIFGKLILLVTGLTSLVFTTVVIGAFLREYRKYTMQQVGVGRLWLAGALSAVFLFAGLSGLWMVWRLCQRVEARK
jgi:uncharacterized membrane protein YvbJ